MNNAIERLNKILALERQQGYRNKAVIGGFARLVERWQQDVAEEATSDYQRALLGEIVDQLLAYGNLAEEADRRRAVDDVQSLVDRWNSTPPADFQPVAPTAPRVEPPRQSASKPAPPAAAAPVKPSPQPTTVPVKPAPQATAAPVKPAPAAAAPVKPASSAAAVPLKPASPAVPPGQQGARPTPVGSASLGASISRLPGIGPRNAEMLAKLGVRTVGDMLWLLPHRYDDYSRMKPVYKLNPGDEITILANLWDLKSRRLPGRNATLITGVISDSTATIEATWFNPYVAKQLRAGEKYVFSGKVESYRGKLVLRNPVFEPPDQELIHTGRMVPVYPLTKGLGAKKMRSLQRHVIEEWGRRVFDYLPESVRQRAGLLPLGEALEQVHFPASQQMLEAARRRLAFDEFFLIQLGVLRQRQTYRKLPAQRFAIDSAVEAAFAQALPFEFTNAQRRAAGAILDDLAGDQPMSRLVQGDVGSGKTVVAAKAIWAVVANGGQAAMMAPTEILAEQHYRSLSRLFGQLAVGDRPVQVALLTGNVKGAERAQTLDGLASGQIDVAIGTHALIQEGVAFHNLGLAIIDEQHRFGVRQRAMLRDKGPEVDGHQEAPVPHLLVMTATPIPRTLSLTVFGDLDASVIDEMPPGRQPIKTRWLLPRERERAYTFIRRQVEAGHQAFIIYPLVEESESISARAAVPEFEALRKEVFPSMRLGLLHGRMKSDEKDAVMRAMQRGEIDILVATSVVEVGIDIPNATMILIEDAERFGLAQLHQFRGRVGRGEAASYCILISDATTSYASERLQALEKSQDGFALAEKDLELRGPGDFFGTRQSGLPDLKLAKLSDLRTLEQARAEATDLLRQDPELALPEHAPLARKARQFWQGEGDVS